MSPVLSEISVYLVPVLLGLLGWFGKNKLNAIDANIEKLITTVGDMQSQLAKDYYTKPEIDLKLAQTEERLEETIAIMSSELEQYAREVRTHILKA